MARDRIGDVGSGPALYRKPARRKGAEPPATDRLPGFVPPQLPTLVDRAPAGEGWLHEIKWDGYRTQLRWDGSRLTVFTRNGIDWSKRFPTVAAAFAALRLPPCVLDAELVALDDLGRSDYPGFKRDLSKGDDRAMVFYAFDALHIGGRNLRKLKQVERKARLEALLEKVRPDGALRYVEHHVGQGPELAAASCRHGLEGIVSKRADAAYTSGPSKAWLKVKCVREADLVIIGWLPSTNGAAWVGSIATGYYAKGKLTYAGHVGTGFTDAFSGELAKQLKPIEQPGPYPVANLSKASAKGLRYVRPQLVAAIAYRAWSGDRLMRGASFKGLREDMAAKDVRIDPGAF